MPVGRAEERERANQSANDREHRQDNQRYCHNSRRFVDRIETAVSFRVSLFLHFSFFMIMRSRAAAAIPTEENAQHQAEHVERSQASRQQTDTPQDVEDITGF